MRLVEKVPKKNEFRLGACDYSGDAIHIENNPLRWELDEYYD